MAQQQLGTNDFAASEEDTEPFHQQASTESDHRMSQSQTLTPSRGGTLKKRNSLSRKTSLKRGGSRKSSRPGSVRSLSFAEDIEGQGSEMQSAFFTPVPTTGSPTDILAHRFQVWRQVLKNLITYFKDVQKSYEARSKSLYGVSNTLANISAPSELLVQGGIGDSMQILRDFHKKSISESNKAKSIQDDVIQQLTGLRSDLGQKIKEIKSLSGDFKNSVNKEIESTRRAVKDLQDALEISSMDPKSDPYLVRLGVDRQVSRQIDEENYLHRAFLNLESSGRELESIVVGEIQKAYNAYASIIKREADEAYEAVDALRSGPLAISKDHEWNAFVNNNEHFVDPRIPVRKAENITYPGKDDPATSEVRGGMLERKSKYLKNYTPGWYVLSTTHLHEFKSPDRIASQSPVMSLPLVDQKLGSRSQSDSTSHKFMLKGRQAGGMHRGHAWVFRAESYDTMLAWYSDIKNLTEKTGTERNEFIRRSHARSLSAGSHKAASISSDGLEEDEADQVPYSANASQAEVRTAAAEDELPQRPNPGGRFPSALNVDRDSQVPASPTSSDEREAIAAAGALPGSGIGNTTQGDTLGDITDASIAPNQYSPIATQNKYEGLSPTQGKSPTSLNQQQTFQRHDSKYGDWMAPVAASSSGEIRDSSNMENSLEQKELIRDEQPGLQTMEATESSIQRSTPDTILSSVPSTADGFAPTVSTLASSSLPADPAAPIKDLANRPVLPTHPSVNTISDLHVPGEFPKGKSSAHP